MKDIFRELLSRVRHDCFKEEIESHIQMRSDLLRAQGMSKEDAEMEARRRFGNTTRIREDVRGVYVSQFLETTIQDVRYTIRTLWKSPVITVVAILTLALAIGANTAIFQLLDAVVLKPLPVSDPYQLFQRQGYYNSNPNGFSYPLLVEMAKRQKTVEGIFATGGLAVNEIRIGDRILSEPTQVRLDPLKTLNSLVSTSVRREHLLASLSAGFAVLALALAAVGLYGIVNYSAQLRAQEISIRIAVGGTSRQILLQVFSEAVLLLSTGTLLGTIATLALSRALHAMLFGLQPNDPVTLVLVGALLMSVGLAAAYIPASRASRLDPIVVLRSQ